MAPKAMKSDGNQINRAQIERAWEKTSSVPRFVPTRRRVFLSNPGFILFEEGPKISKGNRCEDYFACDFGTSGRRQIFLPVMMGFFGIVS